MICANVYKLRQAYIIADDCSTIYNHAHGMSVIESKTYFGGFGEIDITTFLAPVEQENGSIDNGCLRIHNMMDQADV